MCEMASPVGPEEVMNASDRTISASSTSHDDLLHVHPNQMEGSTEVTEEQHVDYATQTSAEPSSDTRGDQAANNKIANVSKTIDQSDSLNAGKQSTISGSVNQSDFLGKIVDQSNLGKSVDHQSDVRDSPCQSNVSDSINQSGVVGPDILSSGNQSDTLHSFDQADISNYTDLSDTPDIVSQSNIPAIDQSDISDSVTESNNSTPAVKLDDQSEADVRTKLSPQASEADMTLSDLPALDPPEQV